MKPLILQPQAFNVLFAIDDIFRLAYPQFTQPRVRSEGNSDTFVITVHPCSRFVTPQARLLTVQESRGESCTICRGSRIKEKQLGYTLVSPRLLKSHSQFTYVRIIDASKASFAILSVLVLVPTGTRQNLVTDMFSIFV